MKHNYLLTFILIFFVAGLSAQTIWTGPLVTFTKDNFADPTLEENQDRITDNVWITRGASMGLFNVVLESSDADGDACAGPEPSGTEWAYGNTDTGVGSLSFVPLGDLIGCNFSEIVDGQDIVLHLIEDDIYINIKFTSWTSGAGSGGGFAYERSSDQSSSVLEESDIPQVEVFPNPSTTFIQVNGIAANESFSLFNFLGEEVKKGEVSNNDKIMIEDLSDGIYFLMIADYNIIKVIKG